MKIRPLSLAFCLAYLFASGRASASTVNANTPIDLRIPLAPYSQTDSQIFDKIKDFSPNYAINQSDSALSDLFDKQSVSNLCFPAALAEALIYLFQYRTPQLRQLTLEGLSENKLEIEPNQLVRQLFKLCGTSSSTGTFPLPALNCIGKIFSSSGYSMGETKLISPFNPGGPFIDSRAVELSDIRNALDAGNPVLLEIAWLSFDDQAKTWVHQSGHYVTVFGYKYNEMWNDNLIQLKIVNPAMRYRADRSLELFDIITVERFARHPGTHYPADRSFIVSGNGFSGSINRGFLGMMFRLDPAVPAIR